MASSGTYSFGCPTLVMLDRVSNRWSVLILSLLMERPRRFNQLRRELGGISQKMLSQTLKVLERDGFVSRLAEPTVPVTVIYSLNPLGASLLETVGALRDWSEANYPDVLCAREQFDHAHV